MCRNSTLPGRLTSHVLSCFHYGSGHKSNVRPPGLGKVALGVSVNPEGRL